MRPGLALVWMRRESRGARGRLLFFAACVALGVAAVVAVAALAENLEAGIRSQSRELLAADLVVTGRTALPPELDALLSGPGIERTNARELATMASAPADPARPDASGEPGPSRLCELKVVDGPYPFYGELGLEPPGRLADVLDAGSAVVAPELLSELRLDVGDEILIGGAPFRVAARVVSEPGRLGFSFLLGPRVFLSAEGLARTALLSVGNRVRYLALVRLPDDPDEDELEAWEEKIEALPGAGLRVEHYREAQPRVRHAIERVEHYLGLVALLSLLLGGIGVAQVVRTWMAARLASVAVMRSLGLRPPEILGLYLGHAALLALAGSAAGAALGALAPLAVGAAAPDLVPASLLSGVPWAAIGRGLLLGTLVAIVFALVPLTAVWRVSPARVLRADAEPLSAPRAVSVGAVLLLAATVFATAWIQGRRVELALWFVGVVGALSLVLWLGARGVVRLVGRLPRARLSPYLANGLAALARPSAGTVGSIVALGLGVMAVLSMVLVEGRLSEALATAIPADAPSTFLIDIQPDQWEQVHAVLAEAGATGIESVPVVMARLAAIDGVPVAELAERGRGREGRDPDPREERGGRGGDRDEREGPRRSRWALTREQRLTYLDALPEGNRLVAGELWSDPDAAEVSLEEGYAEDLGVGLGSRLTFDVQGVPVELRVTSLRTVEWESFGINFFLVVEPGVLEHAPQFRIAAARIPAAQEDHVQDLLARDTPNVTPIRIRAILEKVLALLERLALGVQALGAVTIVAGLLILAGSVGAGGLRRRRESALLKILGVTRRGVVTLFAGEYVVLGLVAGLLGAVGAYALSWGFLHYGTELEPELSALPLVLGVLLSALLAALSGIAASAKALGSRPIEGLRS